MEAKKLKIDPPAFLLVEFVAHDLGELFELALGLCIVALDHDVLKMPEPPGEVVEVLVLLATYEQACCNVWLL